MTKFISAMIAGISLAALATPVGAQPRHDDHSRQVRKHQVNKNTQYNRQQQARQRQIQLQKQRQQQQAYANGYRAGQNNNNYRGPVYNNAAYTGPDQYWRGQDGRVYCRRSDGTTGLVVGAVAGGVLGNVIAPDGNKLLGSVIGGTLGAVVGKEISKGNGRCQ